MPDARPRATYQSYGRSWTHLSNTPFRECKHWVCEGGIATPLLVRWPAGIGEVSGSLVGTPVQLADAAGCREFGLSADP